MAPKEVALTLAEVSIRPVENGFIIDIRYDESGKRFSGLEREQELIASNLEEAISIVTLVLQKPYKKGGDTSDS